MPSKGLGCPKWTLNRLITQDVNQETFEAEALNRYIAIRHKIHAERVKPFTETFNIRITTILERS